jgi:hypothetical protein
MLIKVINEVMIIFDCIRKLQKYSIEEVMVTVMSIVNVKWSKLLLA